MGRLLISDPLYWQFAKRSGGRPVLVSMLTKPSDSAANSTGETDSVGHKLAAIIKRRGGWSLGRFGLQKTGPRRCVESGRVSSARFGT